MGLFTGGEKYYRLSEGVNAKAYGLQQEIQYAQFNRELLSDVRQARIVASQLNQENYSDEFTSSGAAAATANVYSNFAGSYGYTIDMSKRMNELQNLNTLSYTLQKKGLQRDQRSANAAKIVTAGAQIVGSFFGPVGFAIGTAVGTGAVKAMGGGKAAVKAATNQAIEGSMQYFSRLSTNSLNKKGANTSTTNDPNVEDRGGSMDLGASYTTPSGTTYYRYNTRYNNMYSNGIYGSARIPGAFNQ